MATRGAAPQNRLCQQEVPLSTERAARVVILMFFALIVATPAFAQSPLSLSDAIQRARTRNPDVESAAAAEHQAAQRLTQARGGYLPRVDLSESWQRGNHPVFVFSSVLAQRRFTAAGLALDALNHPAATDNFRTAFSVEQSLFDRGTAANVRAASVGLEIATTARQLVAQDLSSAVTEAFGRVLAATATVRSAAAAVETARKDRELAGNRRDAGRVTDADVLQIDVHVARAREQHVQAIADERIARAKLNQLMGEPLTAMFSLDPAPSAYGLDIASAERLEEEAIRNRPEIALARQQEQLAAAAVAAAHAAFLPQVSAQAGWELNGGAWDERSSTWVVGAVARINLFRGFADKARLAEARELMRRRIIETGKAETMVRLDVQVAMARLEAATASEAVGRAAAESARASHRIIRDRYESGLADASLLLRAAEAVQQAEARQISASVNVLTATANLQRAIGKL
jgi:outer membrane protein TolC